MLGNNDNKDITNIEKEVLDNDQKRKNGFNIKDVALGIGNKIGNTAKDIVEKNKYELDHVLNKVIDGEYITLDVAMKKGVLYIGDKEVSSINCESFETDFENDKIEEVKNSMSEYKLYAVNPLHRLMDEKYIQISWRNGKKSYICVDSANYSYIVKILS